jgi:hypothetical protein
MVLQVPQAVKVVVDEDGWVPRGDVLCKLRAAHEGNTVGLSDDGRQIPEPAHGPVSMAVVGVARSPGDLPPDGHLRSPQEGHRLAREDALQARKKM